MFNLEGNINLLLWIFIVNFIQLFNTHSINFLSTSVLQVLKASNFSVNNDYAGLWLIIIIQLK